VRDEAGGLAGHALAYRLLRWNLGRETERQLEPPEIFAAEGAALVLPFANADAIARKVIALFDEGQFDVATLFYSRFRSVISQIPTAQQIIPAAPAADVEPESAGNAVYEYEPSAEEILGDLIPRNIAVQIFRALLENAAGEMGAKMTAMDNATRNAGDMINKLTITYNRQRQAQITKELIEIISGAEAL
jgi:F-type H+-transporting ATPase subunit gamma